MKSFFSKSFSIFFILYFVSDITLLFSVTTSTTFFLLLCAWTLTIMLYKPIIRFFVIRDSFFSRWIFIMAISIIFLSLVNSILSGVWINKLLLNATEFGPVLIHSLALNPVYGIIVRSIIVGFLISLLFYF